MRMEQRVRSRLGSRTGAVGDHAGTTVGEAPARAVRDLSLDINTAQIPRLKTLTGIGDYYAKKIVDGRPYHHREELLTREILPEFIYGRIRDRLIAGPS